MLCMSTPLSPARADCSTMALSTMVRVGATAAVTAIATMTSPVHKAGSNGFSSAEAVLEELVVDSGGSVTWRVILCSAGLQVVRMGNEEGEEEEEEEEAACHEEGDSCWRVNKERVPSVEGAMVEVACPVLTLSRDMWRVLVDDDKAKNVSQKFRVSFNGSSLQPRQEIG